MNYYDEKLLMRHLNSLGDLQTPYYNKICNLLNSLDFNIDDSLKLKHKYSTPKIEMCDIWLEHEQVVEE